MGDEPGGHGPGRRALSALRGPCLRARLWTPSAYLVWTQAPPELRHTSGTPPPGAVVVWSSAIGDGHGHIAISLGDGRMVSTTDGAVSVLPIAGFSDSAYYGWMPPYFYM